MWEERAFKGGSLLVRITTEPSGGSMVAELRGKVTIGNHGCVQVEPADIDDGTPTIIAVPSADAEIQPDCVVFRDGSTLMVGDEVQLTGGYLDRQSIELCGGVRSVFTFSSAR